MSGFRTADLMCLEVSSSQAVGCPCTMLSGRAGNGMGKQPKSAIFCVFSSLEIIITQQKVKLQDPKVLDVLRVTNCFVLLLLCCSIREVGKGMAGRGHASRSSQPTWVSGDPPWGQMCLPIGRVRPLPS